MVTGVKVKRVAKAKSRPASKSGSATSVSAYDAAQAKPAGAVCKKLRAEIDRALPDASSKIWHGSPVWFVGETPVVGYCVPKAGGVVLLFWNGQAFDEPALAPMGQFEAAQIKYGNVSQIRPAPLRRWLKKAGSQLWDLSTIRRARARARA
jgi:hypothetical protein